MPEQDDTETENVPCIREMLFLPPLHINYRRIPSNRSCPLPEKS
jgi:hypothetical protein